MVMAKNMENHGGAERGSFMKSEELFQYLNIQFISEGNSHCTQGWINMHCPFCAGSKNYHLGFDVEGEYFRCWRCGWHPVIETLHRLTGKSPVTLKKIIGSFGGSSRVRKKVIEASVRMKAFSFPSNTNRLSKVHKEYLRKRNFDPDHLEKEWGLKSTGIISSLGESDYGNRIIIPIHWKGELVSYQGRAVSNKEPKYKACPKDRELAHHKHILYGNPTGWKATGICVEGVTDVWRFGPAAFAVFGIEFKMEQIKEICSNFKRVVVVFDDDPQAVKQAEILVGRIRMQGVSAFKTEIVGDPGDMDQAEADYLVKSLLKI